MAAKVQRSPITTVGPETISPKHKSGAGKVRSFWNWLRREVHALWPVFLFFLIGFLLALLIVKLALAEYSISINALSRALLGALLAAKVVLLLESTPVARAFQELPPIVPIVFKSLIYGAGVIVLGLLERILDALRHSATILLALQNAVASLNLDWLLSLALLITLVFGVYFTFGEINEFMGEDLLRGFLLKRRTP